MLKIIISGIRRIRFCCQLSFGLVRSRVVLEEILLLYYRASADVGGSQGCGMWIMDSVS